MRFLLIALIVLANSSAWAEMQIFQSCNANGCIEIHVSGAKRLKLNDYDLQARISLRPKKGKATSFNRTFRVSCDAKAVYGYDDQSLVSLSDPAFTPDNAPQPQYALLNAWCR